MSFYGVGINVAVERIQLQLKLELASKHGGLGIRKLAYTFLQYDKNGNGFLDFSEFEDALKSLGLFYKKIDSQALFKFYDKNGDGQISYFEFADSLRY